MQECSTYRKVITIKPAYLCPCTQITYRVYINYHFICVSTSFAVPLRSDTLLINIHTA